MKHFRIHHLGLDHLPLSTEYMCCAYTEKLVKMNAMLLSLGHEVFFYGAKPKDKKWLPSYIDHPNFHFIETHTVEDIARDYGDGDNRYEIGYAWPETDLRNDLSFDKKPSALKLYAVASEVINRIKKPDDFLLCTMGHYHAPIIKAVNLYLTCEPGVGYRGSTAGRFRAFESAFMQNFTYGSEAPHQCINGNYFDRVIPNYFDPNDIEYSDQKGNYYLFIGRMIKRKGLLTADLVCRHLGAKLVIAGQGAKVDERGVLNPTTLPDFWLEPGTWEYVGYADVEKRKDLMAHAIATFVPTEYQECFGGVHCESMLSGTPVITTNFGVFPATFPEGICGFHCNTLDDFVWAAQHASELNPRVIRAWAERYLMDNVKWEFQRWFEDLHHLWESSVDDNKKGWHFISKKKREWRSHSAEQHYLDVLAEERPIVPIQN